MGVSLELDLDKRVAFVAGSSRGIGKAIAWGLLKEGCRTLLAGRDEQSLDRTRQEFQREFGKDAVAVHHGDLTCSQQIERALADLKSTWGRLDCLIANIGTGSGKPGWELTEEDWQRSFSMNFWGPVRLVQAAVPLLTATGEGAVVFTGSIAGLERSSAPLPYSAAKAALANYSKNLAWRLAGNGIRVNMVAPGNIKFPGGSWETHLREKPEAVTEYINSEVAAKRFGNPEEIRDLVVFLCSPRASFVTGACFVVDGGQTRSL
jgi:3-oxoacyl-[acyl-carrier protein] reductase